MKVARQLSGILTRGVGRMKNNNNELHVQRRGWLKNGNPPGDFLSAPRCGAKTRKGQPCHQPAMKNGRCRLHGGKSTGPITREGKKRSRMANYKHGFYSESHKQQCKAMKEKLREYGQLLEEWIS